MITEPKAILFDFDGTLIDTEPAIMASFRFLFTTYRKLEDFTPEVQVDVLGPSLQSSIEKYFPEHDMMRLFHEYEHFQQTTAMESMVMMEGALELIDWAHAHGMKTGLVSSRRHDSMDFILNYKGIQGYFDVVVGIEDLQKGKPDPEGILKAMHDLQVSSAVYVGDSAADILAGNNAGIPTVAYCTKKEKESALLAAGPDYEISGLMEIKEIIQTLRG